MARKCEEEIRRVTEAIVQWHQGDCVLGEHWMVHRFSPDVPLTIEASEVAGEGGDLAESQVRGFMVATQTCDIVRSCTVRPYIEVCPLVEVADPVLREIERGRRPCYAFVPGLSQHHLVADLDRIMTVEKSVVAGWDRVTGCTTDPEERRLRLALARKRARCAFPDDFTVFAGKLQDRLQSKHDKESDEGRALRSLREIRVRAAPSWGDDEEEIEITFWFIRSSNIQNFEGKSWDQYLEAWLKLVPETCRFKRVDGVVVTLEDLSARDYVESDPLDLDHLSGRTDQGEGE